MSSFVAAKMWPPPGVVQGSRLSTHTYGFEGVVRTFRLSNRSVANIIKAYAERARFDTSTFSGHSLRAAFLTSAAGKGASIFKMMDVSRHQSVDTLRGYVSDAELFKDHAGAGLL
jgi:site-specific recombinase XerD